MDKKSTAAVPSFRHCNDAPPHVTGFEDANLSIVHKRVPLDELKQMGLDVCSDDTVRLNYRTRIGIHIIPGTANLGLQPSFQRAQ
jgi:hypothetical protein